ncbi:MAG: hypothetical protein V1653_02615 [bacterium]
MNIKKSVVAVVAMWCVLTAGFLFAAEAPFDHTSSAILGMGGVNLLTTEQAAPLIYNPAALAYLKQIKISSEFLSLGFNSGILEIYELYKDPEMKRVMNGEEEWQNASSDLKNKMLVHRLAQLRLASDANVMFPVEAVGNFGLGVYGDIKGTIETDKGIYVPAARLNYLRDFAVITSFARSYKLPFWERYLDPFAFGLNLKYLQRQKMGDLRTLVDYQKFSFIQSLHKGWGLGLDLGATYKMSEDRLGLALVFKDIGNTTLKWDNNDSTAILSRFNFGAAYQPRKLYYWKDKYLTLKDNLILAADINDIGRYEDFYKRIHLGAEFSYGLFSVSGGFNQGYPTFGLGLKLGLARLNYAYYGVERGVFAGQDVDYNQSFSLSVIY